MKKCRTHSFVKSLLSLNLAFLSTKAQFESRTIAKEFWHKLHNLQSTNVDFKIENLLQPQQKRVPFLEMFA